MINQYNLKLSYINNGILYASSKEKTGHYILSIENPSDNSLAISVNPLTKLEHIKFTLEYDYTFNAEDKVFLNSYQSWTDCRERSANDKEKDLPFFSKYIDSFLHASRYGDYDFALYNSNKAGFFHGFSYGYVRSGNNLMLIGSLKESTGFTLIYCDMKDNKIILEKDLEGLTLEAGENYELINFAMYNGEYDNVFDNYFSQLKIAKPRFFSKTGYTSWYNYYQNINEDIINKDLNSISNSANKLDIFQIDDGYQTAVGDWGSVNLTKFPSGMRAVANKIHNKDMQAGLWLAPFNAQKTSKLFHEHKDWFIKDSKDYQLCAGGNWGGFYTLNFYLPEVREYLAKVFDTVFTEWNFDMVKLDFLYSVCIRPFGGKTRGQIMHDAMTLLRKLCKHKLILGCGVPMFSAFGLVDFCRTGADVSLSWTQNYFQKTHRECVSTINGINNTIFRRHLDGRAFCNDPDVVILRSDNNKLTLEQRKLLAKINYLCGNLIFVSDDISTYNEEEVKAFDAATSKGSKKVNSAEYINQDDIKIDYIEDGVSKTLVFDITNGVLKQGEI